ncbi:hypothetical protein HYT59_02540 [Candidatus Woesebacteria bacterium]|nr:hypothetical protein [Candidatus Woesebacteria bacterium]
MSEDFPESMPETIRLRIQDSLKHISKVAEGHKKLPRSEMAEQEIKNKLAIIRANHGLWSKNNDLKDYVDFYTEAYLKELIKVYPADRDVIKREWDAILADVDPQKAVVLGKYNKVFEESGN